MQKQADLEVSDSQVIAELTFGDWGKDKAGLCLDDEFVIDDHIDSLRAQTVSFVINGY